MKNIFQSVIMWMLFI